MAIKPYQATCTFTHVGHILYKMCLTDEEGYLTGGGGKKSSDLSQESSQPQTQKKNIKIKHQIHPQGFTCLHLAVIKHVVEYELF